MNDAPPGGPTPEVRIAIVRGVCRAEAREVLELYRRGSGPIYDP